jgi:single-stranded-DNA-specific exonuclease
MARTKRWNIAQRTLEPAAELARRLGVSSITAQILINRGFNGEEMCRGFLLPKLKDLLEPGSLPGVLVAAERIHRSVVDKKKIVIFGDYDVDGVTATSILWHALTLLGADVHTYIPHRVDEGYGLNVSAVEELARAGAQVIVSVDCGITAHAPAAAARQAGVELIITDHHEWHGGDEGLGHLPEASVIVHPRLPGEGGKSYGNPHLCGAGVAFKLAWAVGQAAAGGAKVGDEFKNFLLDATALAALGTIADVVPLVGENRVLAAFGLLALPKSRLRGIVALLKSANLLGKALDAYDVGFALGPRLNACGRMGHARLAVEMMTVASQERAEEIAGFLEGQNRLRQSTERAMLAEAIEMMKARGDDREDTPAIVLGSETWHPGVVGIVASRLVDRYHRPTVLIAFGGEKENGEAKSVETGSGSGRSIVGFHLAGALTACSEHLMSHGGHEMAAGCKVRRDKLEDFAAAFKAHAQRVLKPEMLMAELRLECDAQLREVTLSLAKEMSRLGPFGQGNKRPLLACTNVELTTAPRRVGKNGEHLQLYLRQDGTLMKGIAFNAGSWAETLGAGSVVDIAVEPTINEYMGRQSIEVAIKDIRVKAAGGSGPVDA